MQTVTTSPGDVFQHLPSLLLIRQRLQECEPFGTFTGGYIWTTPQGYVGILLPPVGRAESNMYDWLGSHLDGSWEIGEQWYQDQVEVIHLESAGTGLPVAV